LGGAELRDTPNQPSGRGFWPRKGAKIATTIAGGGGDRRARGVRWVDGLFCDKGLGMSGERQLLSMGDPEAAFVREVADGWSFFADVASHGVPVMGPTGGFEVGEDFPAIGEMHKRAAEVVFEIAVAVFGEDGILFAGSPATGFGPPHATFGLGVVAVVGGEDQRSTVGATSADGAEGSPAVAAMGDLHEAIEHEEGGVEAQSRDGGVGRDFAGVGVEEGDGFAGFPFEEKRLRHRAEFFGEVERVKPAVTELVKAHRDPASTTARFENTGAGFGR